MYCSKCGSPIEDDALFCGECGAPVKIPEIPDRPVQEQAPAGAQKKSRKKLFLIGGIAVGVGIALIVAAILFSVLGSSPESIAKAYVDEMLKSFYGRVDVNKIVELSYPEPIIQRQLAERGNGITREELIDELQENYDRSARDLQEMLGNCDLHFTTEVVNFHEVSPSKLEELNELASDAGLLITDAKNVSISVLVSANKSFKATNVYITVCKVNGRWYAADSDGMASVYTAVMGLLGM